jgi:RecB family exonuclease
MAFSYVIGSFAVNGFIDRVDEYENRVEIIDYKTGKWEVAQKNIKDNLQLGIYALAASIAFPGKEIYAELYYLRSGKRKGHTFTLEDLERVKESIVDAGNTILNDSNFLPISNERICSFCDHAKSGACAVGVMRNKKTQGR